jgi:hypothetical protein
MVERGRHMVSCRSLIALPATSFDYFQEEA